LGVVSKTLGFLPSGMTVSIEALRPEEGVSKTDVKWTFQNRPETQQSKLNNSFAMKQREGRAEDKYEKGNEVFVLSYFSSRFNLGEGLV